METAIMAYVGFSLNSGGTDKASKCYTVPQFAWLLGEVEFDGSTWQNVRRDQADPLLRLEESEVAIYDEEVKPGKHGAGDGEPHTKHEEDHEHQPEQLSPYAVHVVSYITIPASRDIWLANFETLTLSHFCIYTRHSIRSPSVPK